MNIDPSKAQQLKNFLRSLPPDALEAIDEMIQPEPGDTRSVWVPNPGPQTEALASKADILFYGGAAGGGKTDLVVGAALTRHKRSIIFRRESTQATAIADRIAELLKTRSGYNSQTGIWRIPNSNQQIEIGSCPNPGDEMRYQGRPHDLLAFDEAAHFLASQPKFLFTWNRTTDPDQRVRTILASNPPTPTNQRRDANGLWLMEMFGPWLDPDNPHHAAPGELLWYLTYGGKEKLLTEDADIQQAEYGLPFLIEGEPLYAKSRTFIPAKVQDNPFLLGTGYLAQLQSLEEPLRSQMLYGDFTLALSTNPAQVIPTQWVKDAMRRYKEAEASGELRALREKPMTGIGVDAVRGGRDNMVISTRHRWLVDKLHKIPGINITNGPQAAGQVLGVLRDNPTVVVDVIGIGSSVVDHLTNTSHNVLGFAGSEKAMGMDKAGLLSFANKRSEAYWRCREYLDPSTPGELLLPPSEPLLQELTAPTFENLSNGIKITPKADILKALGRSPDEADSVVMNLYYADDLQEDQFTMQEPAPGRGEGSGRRSRRIGWNTPLDVDTSWIV